MNYTHRMIRLTAFNENINTSHLVSFVLDEVILILDVVLLLKYMY